MNKFRRFNSLLLGLAVLFSNCQEGGKKIAEKANRPINIILLIGDGMGLAQISAASFLSNGLSLELFENIGLIKTSSSDDYITDSAAGATAFSTGEKTFNGAIGVGPDSLSKTNIVELAEQNGFSTGLISTCSITHATPAAFFAHQINREMHEEIANDFYTSGIDFIAGGGKPYFDLTLLDKEHYLVHKGKTATNFDPKNKYVWFYDDSIHLPKSDIRGDWLNEATKSGIKFLSNNKKGFFLMVEGSQIDWGGHDNDFNYVVNELKDFDLAIATALEFAKLDGNTLVIVTADHETGGLTLNAGDLNQKTIETQFASKHHSGIMVPVFSYGPGSENFKGVMENNALFKKMKELYKF